MTVRELIEILSKCDPELPVATHANNHDYMSAADLGNIRVTLLHTFRGDHVSIGNPSRKRINGTNWYIIREIDGGAPIPKDWPQWDGRRWDFPDDFGPLDGEPRYREQADGCPTRHLHKVHSLRIE